MNKPKDITLTLKVPPSLIKRLDKAARQGARNRSAEVRARLERSLLDMPIFTGQQAA